MALSSWSLISAAASSPEANGPIWESKQPSKRIMTKNSFLPFFAMVRVMVICGFRLVCCDGRILTTNDGLVNNFIRSLDSAHVLQERPRFTDVPIVINIVRKLARQLHERPTAFRARDVPAL